MLIYPEAARLASRGLYRRACTLCRQYAARPDTPPHLAEDARILARRYDQQARQERLRRAEKFDSEYEVSQFLMPAAFRGFC